jgi:hypothetical protein
MAQARRASRSKRSGKAVSVLGLAGVSLAASTGGSPASMPPQDAAPFQALTFGQSVTLDDEEISDVTLATFHLFDKDAAGALPSAVQVAAHGGCGCGHGCGGCGGRGCGGGFRGCGGGFRGCAGFRGCGGCRGCRGCGWGGCGCGGCYTYCLSLGGCYPWC